MNFHNDTNTDTGLEYHTDTNIATNTRRIPKQAGAELGQAQLKLKYLSKP